jgi:DNA polymerase III alpha subunit
MMDEATPRAKEKHGIKSGVYEPTYEELKEFSPSYQEFLNKYPFVETHISNLLKQPRAISRHAGGVIIAENLSKHMPLIASKGVVQTPWPEGQNVRHLEPMGFIKFDLLGLQTLRDIEECVRNILIRHVKIPNPSFEQIREWYDKNADVDVLDLNDEKVFKVFQDGNFMNVFQFAEAAAQTFCTKVKPTNIIQIATVTSIQRPGPLEAGVDKKYNEFKRNPEKAHYYNEIHKRATEETFGMIIFQEQIAIIAHELGKNISLNEGNYLRKILTKKGAGQKIEALDKIYKKFVDGCLEKGMSAEEAEELFETMENFARYGFNKSHAIAYSLISYQCAYFLTYYPECWCAATLTNQQKTDPKTVLQVKSLGYEVVPPSVNHSTDRWTVSDDGKKIFQPLTSLHGIGAAAYKAIYDNRPFQNINDLLYVTEIKTLKKSTKITTKSRTNINKKVLDVLGRSGALEELMDDRFKNPKQLWFAVAMSKPDTLEEFEKMVKTPDFQAIEDFSSEERVNSMLELAKSYPLDLVVPARILNALEKSGIPPLGLWVSSSERYWFVVTEKVRRETKNGKVYYELSTIDINYEPSKIKLWVAELESSFKVNGLYIAKNLDFSGAWGFSFARGISIKDSFSEVKI